MDILGRFKRVFGGSIPRPDKVKKASKSVCGAPCGAPHSKTNNKRQKRDYHKKVLFRVRIDKNLADGFRELCKDKNIPPSHVVEGWVSSAIHNNTLEKIRARFEKRNERPGLKTQVLGN